MLVFPDLGISYHSTGKKLQYKKNELTQCRLDRKVPLNLPLLIQFTVLCHLNK